MVRGRVAQGLLLVRLPRRARPFVAPSLPEAQQSSLSASVFRTIGPMFCLLSGRDGASSMTVGHSNQGAAAAAPMVRLVLAAVVAGLAP